MRKNISQDVGAIHTSKKGNFQFRNFTFAIFLAEHCIIGIFCLEDNADVKGSKSSLNDKHTKTKDMGRETVVTANRYEVCYVCSVYCATLLSCSLHHSSEGIPDYICFYILGCQGILLYQQGLLICKIVSFFFLFKLHWAVDDFSPVTIEGSPYQCLRG